MKLDAASFRAHRPSLGGDVPSLSTCPYSIIIFITPSAADPLVDHSAPAQIGAVTVGLCLPTPVHLHPVTDHHTFFPSLATLGTPFRRAFGHAARNHRKGQQTLHLQAGHVAQKLNGLDRHVGVITISHHIPAVTSRY